MKESHAVIRESSCVCLNLGALDLNLSRGGQGLSFRWWGHQAPTTRCHQIDPGNANGNAMWGKGLTSVSAEGAEMIHRLSFHYTTDYLWFRKAVERLQRALLTVMENDPGGNFLASKACSLLESMYRSWMICCTSTCCPGIMHNRVYECNFREWSVI